MATFSPFESLPNEILLKIFDHCHGIDLIRLGQVCKRFRGIVQDDFFWESRDKDILVTNQTSKRFLRRCAGTFCRFKKFQLCDNWMTGRYKTKLLFSQRTKLMPWLQLVNDVLFCSLGSKIFSTRYPSYNAHIPHLVDAGKDICRFVVRGDCLISGHRGGELKIWNRYNLMRVECAVSGAHNADVLDVDQFDQTIITGSADGVAKCWKLDEDFNAEFVSSINFQDLIRSLAVNVPSKYIAVGCSGINNFSPLHIWDIERSTRLNILNHRFREGAGITNLSWESPNILLSVGYDTYLRKWDLRAGKCVSSWGDPTDATVYCLATDYRNTVITGTQFNTKAVLWDQRQKNFVQMYFICLTRMQSPVYSLSFNNRKLYAATDQLITELDFFGNHKKAKSYEEIFNNGTF